VLKYIKLFATILKIDVLSSRINWESLISGMFEKFDAPDSKKKICFKLMLHNYRLDLQN